MKLLQLLPIGELDPRLLDYAASMLADLFRVPCEILARLKSLVGPQTWRLLGITPVDLYIPILTFVFGEAQMGGECAVVSTHRLRQEFYGLPPNVDVLAERLLKEAVHELGHTLQLTHCDDYRCAMASSHAVEWIDLKEAALCEGCRERALMAR